MNKVILIGNLSKEPESRKTTSGLDVCSFTLAVSRRQKNADGVREADFINCVAWRQLAELVKVYLHKGSKCCVTGSLQVRTYESQDGSKRYATEVIADEVEFLPSASGNNAQTSASAPQPSNAAEDLKQTDDDDLPF